MTPPIPTAAPVSSALIAGCFVISSVNSSVISAIPFLNCDTVGFKSSPIAIARLSKLFSILCVANSVVFVIVAYAFSVVPAEFLSLSKFVLNVSSP